MRVTTPSLFISIVGICLISSLGFAGTYGGGTGEPDDPYQIWDASDIIEMSSISEDWDKYFILMNNVNLLDVTFTNSPVAPDTDNIRSAFQGVAFSGVFDGDGHTIINLNITGVDKDFIGLFGRLNPLAQIKNLGLENSNISGRSHVAGLVGQNHYGNIISCYTSGYMTGSGSFVGGLVGDNIRGVIESSNSSGFINGESCVGGLVGENSCGSIITSYATGDIASTNTSSYCYVGGLVGWNYSGEISSCYASGSVSGTGNDLSIGGLVGVNYSGSIISCYATGDLMESDSSNCFIGGLVGHFSSGTISSSYATSNFTVSGDSGAMGGLIGENEDGIVASCFWDIETSGINYSAGGKGLTTQQMRTLSIYQFANWSNKGWEIKDGIDTPKLSWQDTSGVAITPAGSTPLSGSGTDTDPYQIHTAEEFASLGWYSDILDKHILLMTDLDLSNTTLYPIGDLGPFAGIFDGNGFVLKNAVIDQPGSDCVGLFKLLGPNGQIKNLDVVGISIQGHNYVGGLLGKNSGGTITSCEVTGSITGTGWYVGGLVGWSNGDLLKSSHVMGSIIGTEHVGGLVGNNHGIITSCFTTGDIFGTGDCIGGLVGKNSSQINLCYARGTVNGNNSVGGLIGDSYRSWINFCYSTCIVEGNVYVGGLIGSLTYPDGPNRCFWNVDSSVSTRGIGNMNPDPFDVIGRMTAEMKMLSTFTNVGWDFTETWSICDGTNYPRLSWQKIHTGDFLCPNGVEMADFSVLSDCWQSQLHIPSEIAGDHYVNIEDMALLSQFWMRVDCGNCGGADITGDGEVNMSDLNSVIEFWLDSERPECEITELTGDGVVGIEDFMLFCDNWLVGVE